MVRPSQMQFRVDVFGNPFSLLLGKRVSRFILYLAVILIGLGIFARAFADSPTTHTVAWGETLYSIARKYDVTPQSIADTNRINITSWVYAGQRLTIPSSGVNSQPGNDVTPSGYYSVRGGDTLFSIATRFGTTVDAIAATNNLPTNGILYVGWSLKIPSANQPTNQQPNYQTTKTHIVQPGDTLLRIAVVHGTTTQAIVMANDLPNDWLIYVGQRLVIPGSSSALSVPAPSASSDIRVSNVPLYRQKQTLTCEEASAAMALRGAVSENQILAMMPRSENPFAGIRGQTNSAYYGGLTDYGVYAHPLQKALSQLGYTTQLSYRQSSDDFKTWVLGNLRAGHPVIWWHTWQDSYQVPVIAKLSDGSSVKLVPYEHVSVIVAASDRGVTYNDPYDATIRFVSWADFQRVSAYFDNMGLVIITN
jgi:LysM repeat protein